MRFEFLGAIRKTCHARGGKLLFKVSGPGGKIPEAAIQFDFFSGDVGQTDTALCGSPYNTFFLFF